MEVESRPIVTPTEGPTQTDAPPNSDLIQALNRAKQRRDHINRYCLRNPDHPNCEHLRKEAEILVKKAMDDLAHGDQLP